MEAIATNKYNTNATKKDIISLIFFSILFLINPFLSVTSQFFLLISYKTKHAHIVSFIISTSLFIGLINATKIPENDLEWYIEFYKNAASSNLFEYIFQLGVGSGVGKEPLFPVLNYTLYYLLAGSTKAYIISISLLSYSLLGFSVYRFGKALGININNIVFSIFLMAFFPYIFTQSAHLIRQFIATSILFHVLIERFFYHKRKWGLILVMPLIHTTTVFFIPLILYPYLKNRFNLKSSIHYVFIILGILGIAFIAKSLLSVFASPSVISYTLSRAANGTTYDLGAMHSSKIIIDTILFLIPLSFIYFFNRKLKFHPGIVHFFNIFFFTILFVVSNLHLSELSGRYNFFIWFFLPFIFLITASKIKYPPALLKISYCAIFSFFIFYINNNIWTYEISNSILIDTTFHYLR